MIAIPIRYRKAERGLFVQKLQHAIPSIVVLGDGLRHLSHNPHGAELALGIFEVVASLLAMGSVVRGIRDLRKRTAAEHADHAGHHGVDWIDIFIGVGRSPAGVAGRARRNQRAWEILPAVDAALD